MLETCRDISECEFTLQVHLSSIRLLGQLPLTENDLEQIFTHIQRSFGRKIGENLTNVIESTPTILACYLVWKGIEDYDEGTYWKSLSRELGSLDVNQQIRLGKFFREFVELHNLLLVEIPGSLKYITPILLHGIIPRTLFPQFFDQIVYPLARKEFVIPWSKEELVFWLEGKREAAKRTDYLEFQRDEILKKLKRVESAKKAITGLDPRRFEQEIQQIEDRIRQEEVDLIELRADLSAIQYNPITLTNLEKDLKIIQRLEKEYRQCFSEFSGQRHAFDEMHREFQRYSSLGIGDPLAINDFDAFRSAAYTTIIDTIAAALEDPEEPWKSGFQDLLTALCDSVAEGNISLPDGLIEQLKVLCSTHEARENHPGLEGVDDLLCDEKNAQASPELGPVSDSVEKAFDYNTEFFLPFDDEIVPVSENLADPDITLAHAQASGAMASIPGLILEYDSFDANSALSSRHLKLHGMHPPDDLPDDPDSGAGSLNQKVRDQEEITKNPIDVRIPEQQSSLSGFALESGNCIGPENLPPLAEVVRRDSTADTNTPFVTSDMNASSHPCQQDVPHAPPEELEVLTPFEPESPTPYMETALQPLSQLRKNAPRTGTSKSRNQYSLPTGSQITEIILTFIGAIIDNLSQFLKNVRK